MSAQVNKKDLDILMGALRSSDHLKNGIACREGNFKFLFQCYWDVVDGNSTGAICMHILMCIMQCSDFWKCGCDCKVIDGSHP